jgi:predicted TIM-barrel fold metal-dependent hydrolase
MASDGPSGRRYVLLSSDCHAGADLRDYKPYLEQRWHDEFDAWAATYTDSWADIDTESEWKAGVSSFMSPLNWDSNKRLEALETEGVVAEVIFPNTVPPFFPNGLLAAPGPRNREEYERRWAGIRAHNRWLKDFCDAAPGRRFGVAQLFVDDVDDAVQEIRWAKEAGMRQVLLPSDHHLKLHNLYYASLDPIWSVCEDLDMPIGRHGSVVGSDEDPDSIDAAHAIGVLETTYFGQRSLAQLILSGVFERHPRLKFVFTELGAGAWYRDTMLALDRFCTGATMDGTIVNMFAGKAVAKLSMLPSEYCARHIMLGASVTPDVLAIHAEIGLDPLMWGADFPHHEGTAPYTVKTLRGAFGSGTPEGVVRTLLAGNAAALYGADLEFLQTVADHVGPTVEEVATPLAPEELPDDPNFRMLVDPGGSVFRQSVERRETQSSSPG